MILRIALLPLCGVVLWVVPTGAPAQEKGLDSSDRITPIVRVVQKCQGSVVAFINPKTGKAMGTGVIVDDRGFIVTNAHVVGKTKSWKLQLIDKTQLTG